MGFLSSILKNNRRNVRDLLLSHTMQAHSGAAKDLLVAELVDLLNTVETVKGVAASSEVCDTILLRRINDRHKIEKLLLKGTIKPFVFLICRN